MPHIVVLCPRFTAKCDLCGAPATIHQDGPPENPKADPRYGGIMSFRCAACTMIDYARYETPPRVHIQHLKPCSKEMEIAVDISGAQHDDYSDIYLDGDVPPCCPNGHEFTLAELAYLDHQANLQLEQYTNSPQLGIDIAERQCDMAESLEDR